jgi:hypothetical protein
MVDLSLCVEACLPELLQLGEPRMGRIRAAVREARRTPCQLIFEA